MQLPEKTPSFLALSLNQRCFLSCWHSLTHQESLDSNRARLHNSRTILKELEHELELEQMEYPDELWNLLSETILIIEADEPLKSELGYIYPKLQKALRAALDPVEKSKKGAIFNHEAVKSLNYLIRDLNQITEDHYLTALENKLKQLVASTDNEFQKIRQLTGILLSDLIDRGWVMESLHSWPSTLIRNTKQLPFEDNLDFMLQTLTALPQHFTLHLRITGSQDLVQLKRFDGFTFSAVSPITPYSNKEIAKYLKPDPLAIFASSLVQAVDYKAASHKALEAFEKCLDRIRFNFSCTKIVPDQRIMLIRGDGKVRLEEIRYPVPNPIFQTTPKAFVLFNKQLDALIANKDTERATIERIETTARHYRLGQDAETYRDKFLNWWMGLEFLTKPEIKANIGVTVNNRVTNLMLERYLFWVLEDLLYSIRGEISGFTAMANAALGARVGKINALSLLKLMQNAPARTDISAALVKRPMLQQRFDELAAILSDTRQTLAYLEKHHTLVSWQIQRLYRIRCCLVHGTPICLRYLLPVSNLEFYLREALVVTLRSLNQPHIHALREVFERADFAWQEKKDALKAAQPNDTTTIQQVAFDGLVLTAKHFKL